MTTTCPNCGHEINAAALLGKAAKGKRKAYSPEEIQLRSERLAAARARRWKSTPKPK